MQPGRNREGGCLRQCDLIDYIREFQSEFEKPFIQPGRNREGGCLRQCDLIDYMREFQSRFEKPFMQLTRTESRRRMC